MLLKQFYSSSVTEAELIIIIIYKFKTIVITYNV